LIANYVPPEDRLDLRYYDILSVLAATTTVCVNMLALKVTRIDTPVGPLTFGGAVVFFPITYILGDVLTEVYGFRRSILAQVSFPGRDALYRP
jgi:uncharacterized PurR-regulated membrane protein YhhQ (DUF165 family)